MIRKGLVGIIEGFHKRNPLITGMGREELRGRMKGCWNGDRFAALLNEAVQAKATRTRR